MNKQFISGHLGADPELRFTPAGTAVCTYRVADTERYKDKDGEVKEHTEWFTVRTWSKQAENDAKYLTKGSHVFVDGKQKTDVWEDDEGKKHYRVFLNAKRVDWLNIKDGNGKVENKDVAEPAEAKEKVKS